MSVFTRDAPLLGVHFSYASCSGLRFTVAAFHSLSPGMGGKKSPCSTKEGKDANGMHQPYRRAAGDFLWLQSDQIDDSPNRDLMVNPWMTHAEIVWKHKGDIFLQTLGCLFPSRDQQLQWLIL